ncbi:MAG: hypothetical protein RL131_566, partial [Bacteroidota bacterium]
MKRWTVFVVLMGIVLLAQGQRFYTPKSVLSEGQWVKISVSGSGIYKITASQLKTWGLGPEISSVSIQLFGNGGQVLPENTNGSYPDDLRENAIEVVDGGDGKFDGQDYFLFYAPGPHAWTVDSVQRSFSYSKNPYTNKAFYFIRVNTSNGLRVMEENTFVQPLAYFDTFDDRYRFEKDSINFLKSGKEWYGDLIGSSSTGIAGKSYSIPWLNVVPGSSLQLVSEVVGRSFGQPNQISLKANGTAISVQSTAPLLGNLLEPVANVSRVASELSINSKTLQIDYAFTAGSVNAQAWLNWFEVYGKRTLDFSGLNQLEFRLIDSKFIQQPSGFQIKNANSNVRIWNITQFEKPFKVKVDLTGTTIRFPFATGVYSEFIAFEPSAVLDVQFVSKVANQNLHGLEFYDMLVIADPLLKSEANRLLAFHASRGLKGYVA